MRSSLKSSSLLPSLPESRIDTKSVRSAGRSTSGVKLLDLDTDDKVASATVIPPEDPKPQAADGTLIQ
jgi:DNA gyrase subunit A